MAWMTKSDYAKHRRETGLPGGSPPAVHYAIRDGRITISKEGLIDSDIADSQWAANTNPKFQASGAKAGAARAEQRRVEKARMDEPSNLLSMPPTPERNDINKSRASKEYYEAELSRLKFEEKQATLIPADTVRMVMYEAGRVIRAGHDDLVAQLSPDLSSETDLAKVEQMLKTAFERLDNEFADKIVAFNEKIGDSAEDSDDAAA